MANQEYYKEELLSLLQGDLIGEGVSRRTYKCLLNPEWVLKVEYAGSLRQNVREWLVWEEVDSLPENIRKWFAPCLFMSFGGDYLIQKRTEPMRKADIPAKVPSFFTDMKLENYGFIGKQLVWHDYGTFILTNGVNSRMKKPRF